MQSSTITPIDVKRPPRVRVAPAYAIDDGLDAIELAAALGLSLDDWQQDIIRCWLGRTEDDKFAARTCGLLVPRQNGKTALLAVRELFGAVVLGERILHTSHEVKTSLEHFRFLKKWFGEKRNDQNAEFPDINALVKTIRNGNGQEYIELKNGGCIYFSARSTGAARGFTVDVTIYDEAQALTDAHVNASLPAHAAAPSNNPQTIYTGTPPMYGSPAEVFGRIRRNAIDGGARMCWSEWSVLEIGDVTDRERWYACNPAMPHRISEETVEEELQNLSRDGFASERLCWWPEQSTEAVINSDNWDACKTETPPEEGLLAYGVKFSADGTRGALTVCLKPTDGLPHVEHIETRDMAHGTQFFVDFLLARKDTTACVVIDGLANAQALIDALNRRGYPASAIVKPKSLDVVAACSGFLNAINEQKVTHYGQKALTDSATKSKRRKVGGSGGWAFSDNNCEAIVVESAALAHWAALTTKRNPSRKQRLVF